MSKASPCLFERRGVADSVYQRNGVGRAESPGFAVSPQARAGGRPWAAHARPGQHRPPRLPALSEAKPSPHRRMGSLCREDL